MQSLLDRTNQALGRLDGITLLLPDPDQFIYTFVRKEAVLSSQIAHRVHDLATRSVIIGASSSAERLGLTAPPVYAAIQRLEQAGILREATGRQRGKFYVYDEYLTILSEGTEPL
jgi:Fic family protein